MHFPANDNPLILNGFEVDPRLAALMRRPDWAGQRTSRAWHDKFPAHPECPQGRLPFIELISYAAAVRENSGIRNPRIKVIFGSASSVFPPGDFDPSMGYVIGFTDLVDNCICVDLRKSRKPRLIYECGGPAEAVLRTAFESLSDFVDFYVHQHGAV